MRASRKKVAYPLLPTVDKIFRRYRQGLGRRAGSVMIGSLFAGTDEALVKRSFIRTLLQSLSRHGFSRRHGEGSKDRYGQGNIDEIGKLVPEGIEGQVPYRGSLSSNIHQLVGGLRAGMISVHAPLLNCKKRPILF